MKLILVVSNHLKLSMIAARLPIAPTSKVLSRFSARQSIAISWYQASLNLKCEQQLSWALLYSIFSFQAFEGQLTPTVTTADHLKLCRVLFDSWSRDFGRLCIPSACGYFPSILAS